MRYVFLIALALPITAHGQSSITATGPLASPIATLPRTPMTADDIIKAAKDNRVVVVQDGKNLWPIVTPGGGAGTVTAECKSPDVMREVYREGWKKTSHKDIACDKVWPGQTVIMPCNWVDVPDERPTDQTCVSPDRLKEAERRYLDQFKPPPIMPLDQYYAPDDGLLPDCSRGLVGACK